VTSYSALSAVSAGVYAALNVSAVTSLATGGVGDDVAQGTGFPFVLYEVSEIPEGGIGSRPGLGQLPMVDLMVRVFSKYEGMYEAQTIMNQVIGALATPPTVSGYSSWAIFHDGTFPVGDETVAGVKVKELVARFRLYVELQ